MERLPDRPDIRCAERTGYPYYGQPRPFTYCDECGEEIYEGDDYYNIGGNIFCENCVNAGKRVAGE